MASSQVPTETQCSKSLLFMNWERQSWELVWHVGHLLAPNPGMASHEACVPNLEIWQVLPGSGNAGKTLVECWPDSRFFLIVVCWIQSYMVTPDYIWSSNIWASCAISGSHHKWKNEHFFFLWHFVSSHKDTTKSWISTQKNWILNALGLPYLRKPQQPILMFEPTGCLLPGAMNHLVSAGAMGEILKQFCQDDIKRFS